MAWHQSGGLYSLPYVAATRLAGHVVVLVHFPEPLAWSEFLIKAMRIRWRPLQPCDVLIRDGSSGSVLLDALTAVFVSSSIDCGCRWWVALREAGEP
jgi:hypothetical protein